MALIEKLKAIADAIRGKTGKTEEMTLDQMATEIAGIQSGGGTDLLQYARGVSTMFYFPFLNSDTLPFETLVVNAPLSQHNYNFFGNINTAGDKNAQPHGVKKIILTVDRLEMSSQGGIIDGISDIEEIEIHANNSENVGAERGQFRFAPSLRKISGIKLNGNSAHWAAATRLNPIWLPSSALEEVRFVPNSMSYNGTYQLGQHSKLSDDSLVSIANAMDASGSVNVAKTIKLHATAAAKLPAIMGTVSDGFFTLDPNGATTLLDFITQTKGWTVS